MTTPHDYYRAKELAKLPGMPASQSGVIRMAKREGFDARKQNGTKALEYHISSLPQATQSALLDQQIANLPETVCQLPAIKENNALVEVEELPAPASLTKWRRDTMDARLQILAHIDQLAQTASINKVIDAVITRAINGLLPEHIQALIPIANARSGGTAGQRTLSRTSLFRWRKLRTIGVTALAPAEPAKRPIPASAPYFLKCWQKPQNPSVPAAMEDLETLLPETIKLPSYSQVQRFLGKMSKVDREKGRRSPKEMRAILPYRRRDTSDLMPLDVCMCDGHSFKAKIAHPVHGRPFHPEVCAVQDAATRLVTGWSAGLAESAQTVADALRHGIDVSPENQRGGIPAIFYTDPGSGNLAKVNSSPVFGRYARLGITFKTGIVGNSQARGMVERLQKSLWIRSAKQLPTFTGTGMDGSVQHKTDRLLLKDIRKTGKSKLLTSWPQFLDLCQQAVNDHNNRPHSSLPKIEDAGGTTRHMTPAECWDMHLAKGWCPDTVTPHELEDLFRPRIQVGTKRGLVRVFGNPYFNSELKHHHGEQVLVEYEPQNGQFVYVRDLEEKLICKAGFDANSSRMFSVSAQEVANEKRAEGRRKRLERQLEEVEQERRGLVDIQPVQNSQIDSLRQQLIEEAEVVNSDVIKLPTDAAGRIRFYRDLQQKINRGAELDQREADWLARFETTTEYQTLVDLDADYAAQAEQ